MPHKHNPVASAVAIAAAVRAPGLVSSMLTAMPQEHERGLGGWQAEWDTLPELVRLAAGASRAIADALEGLVVDVDRMRANLESLRGLTQAEAVVVALTRQVGKKDAQALVNEACRRAVAEERPLSEVLASEPAVTRVLDAAAIARALAPDQYLGQAGAFVDRVVATWQGRGGKDA